jgi:hypothetical protein
MGFVTDDLRYAQAAGVCVEVVLLNGERLLTGVHQVDEEAGFVSLHAPQVFGDDSTTRKVGLDLIASITVTDVAWT